MSVRSRLLPSHLSARSSDVRVIWYSLLLVNERELPHEVGRSLEYEPCALVIARY
jgi:hypothetical protein